MPQAQLCFGQWKPMIWYYSPHVKPYTNLPGRMYCRGSWWRERAWQPTPCMTFFHQNLRYCHLHQWHSSVSVNKTHKHLREQNQCLSTLRGIGLSICSPGQSLSHQWCSASSLCCMRIFSDQYLIRKGCQSLLLIFKADHPDCWCSHPVPKSKLEGTSRPYSLPSRSRFSDSCTRGT